MRKLINLLNKPKKDLTKIDKQYIENNSYKLGLIQSYFVKPLSSNFNKIGSSPYEQQAFRGLRIIQSTTNQIRVIHPQWPIYVPTLVHEEIIIDENGKAKKIYKPGLKTTYIDMRGNVQTYIAYTSQVIRPDFLVITDEKYELLELNGWGHYKINPNIQDPGLAQAVLTLQQERDRKLQELCERCVNCQFISINCNTSTNVTQIVVDHYRNMENLHANLDVKDALDMDNTCADFSTPYLNKFKVDINKQSRKAIERCLAQLLNDRPFWVNQTLINNLDHDPHAFISQRDCNIMFIYDWLQQNNIHPNFLYLNKNCDKSEIMNMCGADVLIDDMIKHVKKCIQNGIPAILIRHYSNQHINFDFIINTLKKDQINAFYKKYFWQKQHRVYKY